MKKKGFIKKSFRKGIILLFLFFMLFSVAGEPIASWSTNACLMSFSPSVCTQVTKNPQFFTRELIIELEHSYKVDIRQIEKALEEQLSTFFQSYAYYDNLAALLAENIKLTSWNINGISSNELADLERALQDTINSKLSSLDQKEKILFKDLHLSTENFYTFGKDKYHSFLTATLQYNIPDQDQDLMLLLLSAGITLKNRQNTTDSLCNDRFLIKGVYVNWAFVDQEYVFTGGPGGLPVSNPGGRPYTYYDITCRSMGSTVPGEAFGILKDHIANPGNSPVDIYIMDTIPSPDKIQYARMYYYPVNSLARELLAGQNILFHITPYTSADSDFIYLPNEKSCNRDLSDHGVFIAGIVRNCSPFADIHLLEVLNRNGSGTLESLLWGYQYALQNQEGKTTPFIINNSLTSKIVLYKDRTTRYTIIREYTGSNSILPIFYALEQQDVFFPALTYVINSLKTYNCALAAAAGNDGLDTPGYPAILGEDPAFPHVLSVGAGNSSGSRSSFSNHPGTQGILAYGGEINSGLITREGTNSLYFNWYYAGSGTFNISGWARWAGSSFSTGIASGAMAALLSRGLYTVPEARDILKRACFLNPANMLFLPVY